MKTLIIYKSYLGTTKKYAEWLVEETKGDIFQMKEKKKIDWNLYDKVVIMSGTYAGWMPLARFLKKNWDKIVNKKTVVIAVGAAPEDDPWSQKTYLKIPGTIRQKIKYFKIFGSMPKDEKSVGQVKKENLNRIIKEL